MRRTQYGPRTGTITTALLSLLLTVPGAVAAENRPATQREEASRTSPAPARSESPQPFSEEEIAAMAAEEEEPGPEVAGGALSNLHLTYVVIALAAAVIVLIAK